MSKEKNVLGKSVSGKRCIREMYKKQNVLGTSIVGKVFHEIPYKFAVPLHARILAKSKFGAVNLLSSEHVPRATEVRTNFCARH